MIEVKNITKSYGNVEILKGIDLRVKKGELISINSAEKSATVDFI